MLNLHEYEGKTIRLTCMDNQVFEGYASDYIFAEDNAPEEVEAIILDYPIRKSDGYKLPNPVEFTALEIKAIEEIL